MPTIPAAGGRREGKMSLGNPALQSATVYNTGKEARRGLPEKVSGAWLCSP